MTGILYLDWAILAVSFFNTILLTWLGLVVLLNAERRTPGLWLTGSSLLMGAAFFVSHSAILGAGPNELSAALDFWWRAGWLPVIALPFAWYLVVLWYAGFWSGPRTPRRERQRAMFFAALLLAGCSVGLLLFANPLPSFSQAVQLRLSPTPSLGGLPLLIVVYPAYSVLCISFALDALLHPGPSSRLMGDLARRRAHPWLVAASLALLVVTLLVAGIMSWAVLNAPRQTFYGHNTELTRAIGWFDLTIASLIAVAALLVGQAVVAYEVFTGKTLPRRGLLRQWRRAIILAAGLSLVVGGSVVIRLRPIYVLLLATGIIAVFYALLSWRLYAERERYMHDLRPFVASQRLYEQLLARSPDELPEADIAIPFRALCENVLSAKSACLMALGPLSSLAGPALVYPAEASPCAAPLNDLMAQLDSPQVTCLPLDPVRHGGAQWAVPLWSERGLIGVLLLGEKTDGGLYAQEEIEMARASGERFVDTLASAGLAQRLMALQRQRLAESRVIDHRARRQLHDDVLPRLHAAILSLGQSQAEAVALLSEVHRRLADLLRDMPAAPSQPVARLGLIGALKQLVADEFETVFEAVQWEIDPEAERQAQTMPALTIEVLFYAAREAMRNAARYARPANPANGLCLRLALGWDSGLKIVIEDNGAGLASQPPTQGSRQGLALHSAMLAVVGGALTVDTLPGAFTRVSLTIPQSAS